MSYLKGKTFGCNVEVYTAEGLRFSTLKKFNEVSTFVDIGRERLSKPNDPRALRRLHCG
ncbi:hypothetical protein [Pyrobaculum islandicum]|uniref:hypothetical protein n=1 Tax=Pyrobaculum islandicum TaxID=2277 RepID=UPI000AED99F2|nr:hypothetical protein [Pyrobaculum islandicum]